MSSAAFQIANAGKALTSAIARSGKGTGRARRVDVIMRGVERSTAQGVLLAGKAFSSSYGGGSGSAMGAGGSGVSAVEAGGKSDGAVAGVGPVAVR